MESSPFKIALRMLILVLCVDGSAAAKTGVLTGDGVGASVLDRVPMTMITRHGRRADFAAVIEAVPAKDKPLVTDVSLEREGGTASVTVRHGDAADTVVLTADGALTVTSAGKTVLVSE